MGWLDDFARAMNVPSEPLREELMSEEKTPRFFVDDNSELGSQLIGDASNLDHAVQNIDGYVRVALDQLVAGVDGQDTALIFTRRDMTDAEVEALPDL